MMLVDADGIEAEFVGVFEHVEVFVVERMAALRVVERVGQVYPDTVIALAEVIREPAIRHEMEPVEFHADSSGVALRQSKGGTDVMFLVVKIGKRVRAATKLCSFA